MADDAPSTSLDAVEETPVWLELNGTPVVTWMCTPDQLDELVVGWLFGEGYIDGLKDIAKMRPCAKEPGFWVDIAPERALLALVWASLAGVVLHLGMLLIKLCASSQRAAGLIGNLVLFPLLMLGGSFVPFDAMPGWLADIGRWTPNGWSLGVLGEIVFERVDFAALGVGTAVLALAACVLYALCLGRLRPFARA